MLMLLPAVIDMLPEVVDPSLKALFVVVIFAARLVKLLAVLMLMLPAVSEAFCRREDWENLGTVY